MKLSIRLRIILWFLLSTFFILSLTATLVFFISNSVMRRTTKNYFISAVEENNDKLKMLSEAEYETASEGFPELWIRGIAPLKDTSAQLFDIAIYLAAFLPFLIIILLSGYLAARGIVRPIKKIEETTTSITDGDNLSLRIPDTGSNDELSALSSNFNKILDRLETSFETEKHFASDASDASHELRTPVSVILAKTELREMIYLLSLMRLSLLMLMQGFPLKLCLLMKQSF